MLRPRLRTARAARALLQRSSQARAMHHLPPLSYDFRQGVPGLFSAEGFDMAWTQYQGLMLEKLNVLVAGTELESKDIKSTLLATAREPNQAAIFNHASMAHNNHFFFKNLLPQSPASELSSSSSAPPSQPSAAIPSLLLREIEASFGSVETLKRELLLTASAMFGPGFVWLVKAAAADYRILPTYLAGSPYAAAHWRRQGTDLSTAANQVASQSDEIGPAWLRKQSQAQKGFFSGRKEVAPGGLDAIPLLCVNTWEHVWLRDYGMGGKKDYLEAWWQAINWEEVASAANIMKPGSGLK